MDDEVGEFMLSECRNALQAMNGRRARPYSGVPAIESDEFLSLSIATGDPSAASAASNHDALSEEILSAAALVQLARHAFNRTDFLSKSELREGSWLFYAVVARTETDAPVAFVKQYNPQRGFKTGRLVTSYANTLKKFDDPIFNWDFGFDVIVAPDEIAVLRITAFERVFSDLDVLAAGVPDDISTLGAGLEIEIDGDSLAVLTETCATRATLARQLKRVAAASHLNVVTSESLRQALTAHGLPSDRFGTDTRLRIANDEDARVLLDMLEGRYYEGDFSGEHRRADRYSPRA